MKVYMTLTPWKCTCNCHPGRLNQVVMLFKQTESAQKGYSTFLLFETIHTELYRPVYKHSSKSIRVIHVPLELEFSDSFSSPRCGNLPTNVQEP